MKRNMAEVGEVEVEPINAEFSAIVVAGLRVKVPTSAVEDILKKGPSKMQDYTLLPTAPR